MSASQFIVHVSAKSTNKPLTTQYSIIQSTSKMWILFILAALSTLDCAGAIHQAKISRLIDRSLKTGNRGDDDFFWFITFPPTAAPSPSDGSRVSFTNQPSTIRSSAPTIAIKASMAPSPTPLSDLIPSVSPTGIPTIRGTQALPTGFATLNSPSPTLDSSATLTKIPSEQPSPLQNDTNTLASPLPTMASQDDANVPPTPLPTSATSQAPSPFATTQDDPSTTMLPTDAKSIRPTCMPSIVNVSLEPTTSIAYLISSPPESQLSTSPSFSSSPHTKPPALITRSGTTGEDNPIIAVPTTAGPAKAGNAAVLGVALVSTLVGVLLLLFIKKQINETDPQCSPTPLSEPESPLLLDYDNEVPSSPEPSISNEPFIGSPSANRTPYTSNIVNL